MQLLIFGGSFGGICTCDFQPQIQFLSSVGRSSMLVTLLDLSKLMEFEAVSFNMGGGCHKRSLPVCLTLGIDFWVSRLIHFINSSANVFSNAFSNVEWLMVKGLHFVFEYDFPD